MKTAYKDLREFLEVLEEQRRAGTAGSCNKCQFSWRSTENVVVMEKFRLDDDKIAGMQMIPPIPPLDL